MKDFINTVTYYINAIAIGLCISSLMFIVEDYLNNITHPDALIFTLIILGYSGLNITNDLINEYHK